MSVSTSPRIVSTSARRRYAIVGLGSRHELYQDGIEKTHAAHAELVALCDSNPGRVDLARNRSAQNGAIVPPGYRAADFDRMTPAQQLFWRDFKSWLYSDRLVKACIDKFKPQLKPRLSAIVDAERMLKVSGDALLVNDRTNYAIGPHTDNEHRLLSFLFYLPKDDSMRELGTSVYQAKDPSFESWDGLHYDYDLFDRVATVEYLPNRLLLFPKTGRSFHGVEPIKRENVNRPLVIHNVRVMNEVKH